RCWEVPAPRPRTPTGSGEMVPTDRLSRGVSGLLAAAALAGVLILAAGRRPQRAGLAQEGAGPATDHEQERERSGALLARGDQRDQTIRELLAGRLTLLEAAARFRALDRAPPAFDWEVFRSAYPGDSDEERHCRKVIGWVEVELNQTDPCLALATCARLLGQLEKLRRRGRLRVRKEPAHDE